MVLRDRGVRGNMSRKRHQKSRAKNRRKRSSNKGGRWQDITSLPPILPRKYDEVEGEHG